MSWIVRIWVKLFSSKFFSKFCDRISTKFQCSWLCSFKRSIGWWPVVTNLCARFNWFYQH